MHLTPSGQAERLVESLHAAYFKVGHCLEFVDCLEQSLGRLGFLNDNTRLPVLGQNDRAVALAERIENYSRVTPKFAKRTNLFN